MIMGGDWMNVSKAQLKATAKYELKVYDAVRLRVKKGRKEELKAIAEEQGQSLNAFVLSAIDEKIERLEREA